MDRAEIWVIIRGHLAAALELDEADITESSNLFEELDADSLDLLELILIIKEQFGITVDDGEVKFLLTELAQFLPDQRWGGRDLSDADLAEVARQLTAGTIVDFVSSRVASTA
jgi:acyl carrier protein